MAYDLKIGAPDPRQCRQESRFLGWNSSAPQVICSIFLALCSAGAEAAYVATANIRRGDRTYNAFGSFGHSAELVRHAQFTIR